MKIEPKSIKIRDVFDGYRNNDEKGVVGFHGRLNIRPEFQREFIYKEPQRNAVIDTVLKGFPLNVMYWSEAGTDADGKPLYELLDGQQRTMSICEYLNNKFSIEEKYFHTYQGSMKDKAEKFLDTELQIYVCKGTASEKLEWFKTINIAGEKLTDQELLNAVYTGPWLTKAKSYFSKTNCNAKNYAVINGHQADNYMTGASIRQEYLATVLKWIADRDNLNSTAEYMALHQHDEDCEDIKQYFENVMTWVGKTFTEYRKEMKGIDFGLLYNKYHEMELDPQETETKIYSLMGDYEVSNKKGIYTYIFDGNEKNLNLRLFPDNIKIETYERQNHICPMCKKEFKLSEMQGDHIIPWSKGGKTIAENCQMLCKKCNLNKSNIS